MTIQSVVKMGASGLARVSQPVKNFTDGELHNLIKDMQDTMLENNGVGIAAPQVGCNLQVVIFGFEENVRYPDADSIPFTVLVNPTIKVLSDEMVDGWEGCLSVPGLRGLVPRYKKIAYSGFNQHGEPVEKIVTDFHARVVQHETDHLHGILYPARIKNFHYFGYEAEIMDLMQSMEVEG